MSEEDGSNVSKGILSERPVAKILVVLGILVVVISLLANSSTLAGIGWAAILASAIVGSFFNA